MILLDRTVSGNLKSSLMNSDGKNELNVKTKCKIITKGINMSLMYGDKNNIWGRLGGSVG